MQYFNILGNTQLAKCICFRAGYNVVVWNNSNVSLLNKNIALGLNKHKVYFLNKSNVLLLLLNVIVS
jgi:hypothetical protein